AGLASVDASDFQVLRRAPRHHVQRVVMASVEHDHDVELALVMRAEKLAVIAQGRLNPLFFVVSGDQQQQAGSRSRHGFCLTARRTKGKRKRSPGKLKLALGKPTRGRLQASNKGSTLVPIAVQILPEPCPA